MGDRERELLIITLLIYFSLDRDRYIPISSMRVDKNVVCISLAASILDRKFCSIISCNRYVNTTSLNVVIIL